MTSSKKTALQFSIVVPVYNRPKEVKELLESLCQQTMTDFEVVIVEDGSEDTCQKEVESFQSRLDVKYLYKKNSGPGLTRNYGFERAKGNYAIFLDSDCVLPPQYMKIVAERLKNQYVDAYGGPDKDRADFKPIQKAISYAMTSFLTTGGIRGGGEKLDKFYPRSFNMGYSREVFEKTGGFSSMRFGEDIDMSLRILKKGFHTKLFKDAFVYHKRRTNLKQFFKQVYNSGIARINLYKRHPGSLKLVHTLPTLFTLGVGILLVLCILFSPWFLAPLALWALLIFFHATFRYKSGYTGLLTVLASFVQLMAYGIGFFIAVWKRIILSRGEYAAFTENFYE